MKKIACLIVLAMCFCGCVTVQKAPEPQPVTLKDLIPAEKLPPEEAVERPDTSPELQNIKSEELEEYVQKKGVVFSKTDFQGLLETRYVKFLFQDLDDPQHKFQLHIGESTDQQTFPWDVKTVKPGYFFVELPVGRYRIASVSIPVGSTTATEDMNVTLEVLPNTICYVGTLKMVGTKERIKLGGLPVIKPGFEYTVEVLDQREEGFAAFRRNYPEFQHDIVVKLMEVNEAPSEKK